MLSTNKIKLINALKLKKGRTENNLFIAEGPKVVSDLMVNNYNIVELYATVPFIESYNNLLSEKRIDITEISEKELGRISGLKTPNQVLAVCKIKEHCPDLKEILSHWSFVLDGVNDPGNMGTIIRIAHWFNIRNIICASETVDIYNPKTVQSTMGSLAFVKTIYTDLKPFLKSLGTDFPLLGTFMSGQSIYDADLDKKGIIVFGSESHGISKEVSTLLNHRISIPSTNITSCPDSLNVAVSAGIISAELLRKGLLK